MNAKTGQIMIGYVENVVVTPGNLRIKAKIDTGALSSSIDAINILPFQKDGQEWVRFTVLADDDTHSRVELPVLHTVGIKRAGAPTRRRYVVEMGICLGGIYKKTQVNLAKRDNLNYRMLIGRRFIAGDFVIDPNKTFLTRPACQLQ